MCNLNPIPVFTTTFNANGHHYSIEAYELGPDVAFKIVTDHNPISAEYVSPNQIKFGNEELKAKLEAIETHIDSEKNFTQIELVPSDLGAFRQSYTAFLSEYQNGQRHTMIPVGKVHFYSESHVVYTLDFPEHKELIEKAIFNMFSNVEEFSDTSSVVSHRESVV